MRRGALFTLVLALFFAATATAANWPTFFYYQASGRQLLGVQVRAQAEPVCLVFGEPDELPPGVVAQFGEAIFLGDGADMKSNLTAFRRALAEQNGEKNFEIGAFSTGDVVRIQQLITGRNTTTEIDGLRGFNLNAALADAEEIDALLLFMDLTSLHRTGVKQPSRRQINSCRPMIERNLNALVTHGPPGLLMGTLRVAFSMAECLNKKEDADGDGIVDVDEVQLYGTDPRNKDTDNDGIDDGREIALLDDFPALKPTRADSDGDGLSDGEEFALRERGMLIDPGSADTDGDSISDSQELSTLHEGKSFDPTNSHSFSPTVGDGEIFKQHRDADENVSLGAIVLIVAAILLAAAIALLLYFWRKDKDTRITRQKALQHQLPETFRPAPKDTFARHAPGTGSKPGNNARPNDEKESDAARPPAEAKRAARTHSLMEEMWEGVFMGGEEDDDMPDPEARKAIAEVKESLSRLESHVIQLSSAVTTIAERLDKLVPNLDSRLKGVENAILALQKSGGVIQDKSILKKFNEQELLIGQSMNEMGRLLDDYSIRIQRLESQIRLMMD